MKEKRLATSAFKVYLCTLIGERKEAEKIAKFAWKYLKSNNF